LRSRAVFGEIILEDRLDAEELVGRDAQGLRQLDHDRPRGLGAVALVVGDHAVGDTDGDAQLVPNQAFDLAEGGIFREFLRGVRMAFERITVDPNQMSGVPCIRGLRIPVATVISMLADGLRADEVLRHLPDLEVEDIREALRYAAEAVRERELPVASG
jgi:uncharacterized protein (DUF433 family)